MKVQVLISAAGLVFLHAGMATAQQPTSPAPPTTASAELLECAQAQLVVDKLLESAASRMEMARQTNSAADMRAAIDGLQNTLRDVRAQLAPCASLEQPVNPHAGHTMPSQPMSKAPSGTPAMAPGSPMPAAGAPSKPAGVAKPPAVDPHAAHTTTPAKPAAPATKPSAGSKPPAAKPAAPDPHAGHTMAPAKPAPGPSKPAAKPAPAAKPPADPHAAHPTPPGARPEAGQAVDPVCGLKVDPDEAPNAKHAGQTYYFCSTQHRDLFTKNPAKFLPGK